MAFRPTVTWQERPFGTAEHMLIEAPGRNLPMPTILEVVRVLPGLPRGFLEVGQARINGELVPRHLWAHVKLKARPDRDVALTLHMPLHNSGSGGGGGKSTIATVATIAVLLAAAAVSGGAAAGLIPVLIAGSVEASVAGAAIGIGGALLISAIFKPPSLSVANTQTTAPKAAANLTAALQGNALSPGAAVPRVIGTLRVFPPILSPPLTELVNGNLYAEAVYGLAGPHSLAAIQSDGVNIDDPSFRNEVSLETQEGLLNVTQTLVTRQGFTDSLNLTMSQAQLRPVNPLGKFYTPELAITDAIPQWHQLVTRDSPDEFWISLGFPSGLGNPGNATPSDRNLAFRIAVRLQGTSTWTNCPELHLARDSTLVSAFEKEIRLKWAKFPAVPVTPPDSTGAVNGWIYAFKNTPVQNTAPVGIGGWTADASFSLGAGSDVLESANPTGDGSNVTNVELFSDRAIIYLDPDVFPKGTYEVQIIRGWSYLNKNITTSSYQYLGDVLDFFQYLTSGPNNIIGESVTGAYDQAIVNRTASVWLENPIQSGDFATISVRVTGRALGQVSVLASGYTQDWDGTGWNTVTTTSNPAPHFRDVLGGILGGSPLPAALIDDAGLVAWRAACTSLGYNCNAVVEGKTYIDVLNLIASCGYAALRSSELWGVIRDRDRSAESPVQIFTPRNMQGFTWTKAFTKLPTGFRVSYVNSAEGLYNTDELIIFSDDVNQDASSLESISYDGLVTSGEVTARALYDLGQGKSRLTFYSGTADIESLVCQRGDLVGVQHDILVSKAGFARVKSVQAVGALVTGLTFEGTVTVDNESGLFSTAHLFTTSHIFTLGSRTGVAIRLLAGGGNLVKEIVSATTNGEVTAVTFVTPFTDPGTSLLDADCLCAVGPLGTEYKRLLVYDWVPNSDMTVKITFQDEAPELWNSAGYWTSEDGDFILTDDEQRITTE